MKAAFNLRLFIYLTIGFILATAIGTVSHEAGHYIAAKYYGYPATLHYASVNYGNKNYNDERLMYVDSLYNVYKEKIESKKISPEKEYFKHKYDSVGKLIKADKKFQVKKDEWEKEHFTVTLWGPLQTMITGTIGFLHLYINRNRTANQILTFKQWLLVYLAFFWSRQVFNFSMSVIDYLFTGNISYRGDEVKLSYHLNIPIWSVGLVTGAIGIVLLVWVVFKVIPRHQRITFIAAGLTGSAIGFYLWMDLIGPAILP